MEHLFNSYNELLKSNPMVAGFIPLMAMGLLTFIFLKVPVHVWSFFKRQCTTSLVILSSGSGSANMQYHSFLTWFLKNGHGRFSRSFAVESTWTDYSNADMTPGNGNHLFIWKGRLCWLEKARLVQGGTTSEVTHELMLTMIGRNRKLLEEMIDEFRWRPSKEKGHLFHPEQGGTGWSSSNRIVPRQLSTVILNEGIKETLLSKIDWFLANREWYATRGLPWRLIILLSGPPGTGKTSLLRALTTHYQRNICPLNLATVSEDKIEALLRTAPEDAFIVTEDFDSCPSVLKDEYKSSNVLTEALAGGKSALLQALDGVDVLDGQIIFMTTNHLEKIDLALIRDERVNMIIEIGLLENEAVHRYLQLYFPEVEEHTQLVFKPIAGATLQKLYMRNHTSYRDFVSSIPVVNPDEATAESNPPKESV